MSFIVVQVSNLVCPEVAQSKIESWATNYEN